MKKELLKKILVFVERIKRAAIAGDSAGPILVNCELIEDMLKELGLKESEIKK